MSEDLLELASCPVCGGEKRGHRYAKLASRVHDPKCNSQVESFLEAIRNKDWDAVLPFQEFRGDSDVAFLYGIRCPHGGLALVIEWSPVEFFQDEWIEEVKVLSPADSAVLETLVKNKNWKPLF